MPADPPQAGERRASAGSIWDSRPPAGPPSRLCFLGVTQPRPLQWQDGAPHSLRHQGGEPVSVLTHHWGFVSPGLHCVWRVTFTEEPKEQKRYPAGRETKALRLATSLQATPTVRAEADLDLRAALPACAPSPLPPQAVSLILGEGAGLVTAPALGWWAPTELWAAERSPWVLG